VDQKLVQEVRMALCYCPEPDFEEWIMNHLELQLRAEKG
jgi:hypothetical protein